MEKEKILERANIESHYKRDSISKYRNLFLDPEKKQREQEHECVICYYLPGFGGAAMTFKPCLICEKEISSGSTNIDKLCPDCAKKTGLCKHCGADRTYRNRRVL